MKTKQICIPFRPHSWFTTCRIESKLEQIALTCSAAHLNDVNATNRMDGYKFRRYSEPLDIVFTSLHSQVSHQQAGGLELYK